MCHEILNYIQMCCHKEKVENHCSITYIHWHVDTLSMCKLMNRVHWSSSCGNWNNRAVFSLFSALSVLKQLPSKAPQPRFRPGSKYMSAAYSTSRMCSSRTCNMCHCTGSSFKSLQLMRSSKKSCFYGTQQLITVFTKLITGSKPQPGSLRSILTLSFNLHRGIAGGI
jgi:hypothetical protein